MTPDPAYAVVSFVEAPVPRGRVICKFVVIEDAHTRHLVFGPVAKYAYHADLVARFCADHLVAAGWARRPDVMEIYDPSVRLRGGGVLEVDRGAMTMEIYGASRAYGDFRRKDVEHAIDASRDLAGYRVSFRNVHS